MCRFQHRKLPGQGCHFSKEKNMDHSKKGNRMEVRIVPRVTFMARVYGQRIGVHVIDKESAEGRTSVGGVQLNCLTLDQADQLIAQLTEAAHQVRNAGAIDAIVDPLEEAEASPLVIAEALEKAGFDAEAKKYHSVHRQTQVQAIVEQFHENTPPGTMGILVVPRTVD
jgi:hypothetical protein